MLKIKAIVERVKEHALNSFQGLEKKSTLPHEATARGMGWVIIAQQATIGSVRGNHYAES